VLKEEQQFSGGAIVKRTLRRGSASGGPHEVQNKSVAHPAEV